MEYLGTCGDWSFSFFFSFCFFITSCKSSTHGHVLEQTPGDIEGQGNLVCRSSWGRKESDTTELLNNNNLHIHSRLQVQNKQKTNNPSSYKFSTQTGYLIPEHLKFFTLLQLCTGPEIRVNTILKLDACTDFISR